MFFIFIAIFNVFDGPIIILINNLIVTTIIVLLYVYRFNRVSNHCNQNNLSNNYFGISVQYYCIT